MQEQLVLIRNSERTTWRRCRQKWHWSYRKYYRAARQRGALPYGTMIHEALAHWYPPGRERGVHPADTFAGIYANYEEDFAQWDEEGNRVPADELGAAMLKGYVETYGSDPLWEMIAPEQAFQVDVYDRKGNYLCTMVGRFDGLARDLNTGRIFIPEHKTAKTIEIVRTNSNYGEQGITYWWAATLWLRHQGILGPKENVDLVLYNFLKKALPDVRPRNAAGHCLNKPSKAALAAACDHEGASTKGTVAALVDRLTEHGWDEEEIAGLGEPSKNQPPPLFSRQPLPLEPVQLEMFERRLRREAQELRWAKERKLAIYKNPTKDCSWDCDFADVCEIHEMGGDWKSVLEFEFKSWDPYEDHELILEKG